MSYKLANEKKSFYWKKRSVMRFNEKYNRSEMICSDMCEVFKRQTKLPDGYSWEYVDVTNQDEMIPIVKFININNNNELETQFEHNLSLETIKWQMGGGGVFILARDNITELICGLIGCSVKKIQIWEDVIDATQPYFLCVDPMYRGRGLAKLLMDEVIFWSIKSNMNVGIFCTNKIVPSPVVQFRHYCRPLDYKYLHDNEFLLIDDIDKDFAHNRTKIRLKPDKNYVCAKLNKEHVSIVHSLYNKQMETYNIHQVMERNEIEHYFFNDDFVTTLIVYSDDEPVDFVTYYSYNVTNKKNGNIIKCANILMYSSLKVNEDVIIINALKNISFDGHHVVYVTDMMGNSDVLLAPQKMGNEDTDDEERDLAFDLNFLKTKRKTMLNLFNWKCQLLTQSMVSWLIF